MRTLAAAVGGGALVAMGGIGVASTSWAAPEPAPPGPVTVTEEATTGATTVETTAPSEPTTSSAAPEITGPAPLPPEEEGLPG
ncbi:hypothetical protein MMAD_40890 [Mycolicibacterium madagascariense]|uniref:Uncharacterized protein n=1 Tax=Mycolicibacterium madagascariense TaxID=212765 RepID=A0A7I7XKQ1_9MYCO|nr:hypothetical protein MMAD_40890 [Mycolicibacterium madagascariense]